MCGVWSRSRQIACRQQMVNDVWDLDWLWCSYWLYILIRSGDYELLLVISFLLVALYVPAGRLYGSYWSAYGFFCLPYSILFVIAASNIGPQTPLDLGRCFKVYHLPPASSVHKDAYSTKVTKLTTGRLVNGSSCDKIDMIKVLYDVVGISGYRCRVLLSSRWKELSKETSSKILSCGDGSCWKTFKPIASLIAKGNVSLKILSRT
ncbi:hypothetical protein Tco_0713614 [Tanacetum coccineum]